MKSRAKVDSRPQLVETNPDYDIVVVGAPRATIRDFYFNLVRLSWPRLLLIIIGTYLTANALYALGYLVVGGVEHMPRGDFFAAYFFSIQTMGTIGYGGMIPQTLPANFLVVAESVTSLLVTALSTGSSSTSSRCPPCASSSPRRSPSRA